MRNRKKKNIAEWIALIVWIIGTLFYGIYAFTSFRAIGSPYESTADCIKNGIVHVLWFLAYASGSLYLYDRRKETPALLAGMLCTIAYASDFVRQMSQGGSFSSEYLITMILTLAAFTVFAAFVYLLVKSPDSLCGKFWYFPAVFQLFAGIFGALWTELVRPDGFLLDGLLVDLAATLVQMLPVVLMLLVIRLRGRSAQY